MPILDMEQYFSGTLKFFQHVKSITVKPSHAMKIHNYNGSDLKHSRLRVCTFMQNLFDDAMKAFEQSLYILREKPVTR